MTNNETRGVRFLLAAFLLVLVVMLAATLYPYNFYPPNVVTWLSKEPGLYFNGNGVAFTEKGNSIYAPKSVSVKLWLKERSGSKNWGPREIFSFYDGHASPSLLVGQWGGRIFVYSRFEKNEGDKWYKLFRTGNRFPRGRPHLVTVTFGEGGKAICIDGELNEKRRTDILDSAKVEFSGRLMLGNSPIGKHGWWGEIRGLAIYNRVLLPKEIMTHSNEVFQNGMHGLAETHGCLALYTLDEGKGNTVESIVGESRPFFIPPNRNSMVAAMFHLPHKDMRNESLPVADFLRNIILFLPFGILFSAIIFRKHTPGYFAAFLVVTFAGGFLSLAIELLQLFLPTRASGISDVLGNMVGSGLGVIAAYSLRVRAKINSQR